MLSFMTKLHFQPYKMILLSLLLLSFLNIITCVKNKNKVMENLFY